VTEEEAPEYFSIIKTPMDFTTMRTKLNSGKYTALPLFYVRISPACCSVVISPHHNPLPQLCRMTLRLFAPIRWPTTRQGLSITKRPSPCWILGKNSSRSTPLKWT